MSGVFATAPRDAPGPGLLALFLHVGLPSAKAENHASCWWQELLYGMSASFPPSGKLCFWQAAWVSHCNATVIE